MTDPRKPYADALRSAGLDFNRPGVVSAFDAMLDKAGVPREGQVPAYKIGPKGLDLIKRFEGLSLTAYPDPGSGGKPWTIGVGTTVYPDGRHVKPGDKITETQADEYLRHDVARFEKAVSRLLPKTTPEQFDALVSFAYNVGEGALEQSTLRRLHNAGDYDGAAAQFARWNKAAGRVLNGLVKRRAAEAALYKAGKP